MLRERSGRRAFEEGTCVLHELGKILAVGSAGSSFTLARYNPNGSLDATFGTGGKVLLAPTRLTVSADR